MVEGATLESVDLSLNEESILSICVLSSLTSISLSGKQGREGFWESQMKQERQGYQTHCLAHTSPLQSASFIVFFLQSNHLLKMVKWLGSEGWQWCRWKASLGFLGHDLGCLIYLGHWCPHHPGDRGCDDNSGPSLASPHPLSAHILPFLEFTRWALWFPPTWPLSFTDTMKATSMRREASRRKN